MNREQLICVLIGILALAGMFLCVPVSIQMMSLFFYAGDTNAGMNQMTFYEFMPEGWPKCINYGVLFWQCFFLAGIISCLVFVFRRNVKKPIFDIKKWERLFSFILITVSVLCFLLWFIAASFGYVFWMVNAGLLIVGLLGFVTTFSTIDVFVATKRTCRILETALISFTGLALCMIRSYWGHRYIPNDFRITPNMWRLFGVFMFLGTWIFYGIYQFVQKNKESRTKK